MAESVDDDLRWFAGLEGIRAERVNGILLLRSAAPGPVRGGLLFRVGTADEPLPLRGVTHLIEHLAVHGLVAQGDHSNGFTGPTMTGFITSGSEQHVVEFLNHVCAALREPPFERLDAERSILRVEAQNRIANLDSSTVRRRYGMTGLARGAYLEFGVDSATVDEVAAWVRSWFVNGNAVAWITTEEIPAGLNLQLPAGERRIFTNPPALLSGRPAWIEGPPGRVLIEAVVPRTSAGVLFTEVLTKTLFRRLRVEEGLSYSAGAHYDPLDADEARIVVLADAYGTSTDEVTGSLAEVLMDLREGRIDAADVSRARETIRQGRLQAASGADQLAGAAGGFLLGGSAPDQHELDLEIDALTHADLQSVAEALWRDAIWQSPSLPERAEGVRPVPTSTDEPVTGSWYEFADSRDRLVRGEDGLSVVTPNSSVTILFAQCALVMQWPDGGRTYFRDDGAFVELEPTLIPTLGDDARAALDAAVRPEIVARRPERAAEDIPQPSGAAPPGKPRGLGAWALVMSIFLFVASAFLAMLAVFRTVSAGRPDAVTGGTITLESVTIWWVLAVLAAVGGALLLRPAVRRIRWRKQRGLT